MTHTFPRAGRRTPLAVLVALLLLSTAALRAAAADANAIKGITTVVTGGGPAVEITLTSTRQFDVRDDLLLLRVGASTFKKSHAPPGGGLKAVVFVLTPAEFAAVKSGDPVVAYFSSRPPTGADSWNFGKLDKGLLK